MQSYDRSLPPTEVSQSKDVWTELLEEKSKSFDKLTRSDQGISLGSLPQFTYQDAKSYYTTSTLAILLTSSTFVKKFGTATTECVSVFSFMTKSNSCRNGLSRGGETDKHQLCKALLFCNSNILVSHKDTSYSTPSIRDIQVHPLCAVP